MIQRIRIEVYIPCAHARPQPVPAEGQVGHAASMAEGACDEETAKAENIFAGLPFAHFGHFAGMSLSFLISTSN